MTLARRAAVIPGRHEVASPESIPPAVRYCEGRVYGFRPSRSLSSGRALRGPVGSAGMTEQAVTDWLSLPTERFSRARIAVLPVAAVEHHLPHLPVGVETYIADAYFARRRALLR